MSGDERNINWTEIDRVIESKQTSWIKNYTKKELIEICQKFGINVSESDTIDKIRIKEKYSKGVQAKMAMCIGQPSQYKKGDKWEAFYQPIRCVYITKEHRCG
jgi:hypothetical protein